MRKDINWTPDYEPQEGDRVTLLDGVVEEYTASRAGPWSDWRIAIMAFARAIGKVSRLVPDPVPPEGYRLATDEDRKGPKPKKYMRRVWHDSAGWMWLNGSRDPIWHDDLHYAVPLASAEKENGAEGIECVVFDHAGFGYLVSPVNPTQKAFNAGDRVRVVPVEG